MSEKPSQTTDPQSPITHRRAQTDKPSRTAPRRSRRFRIRTEAAAQAYAAHPKDLKAQVVYTLGKDIPAAIGTRRMVSEARVTSLRRGMGRALDGLAAIGIHHTDVRNISRKNVVALVKYWTEQKEPTICKNTLDQYVDVIRCYMQMIGRAEVVPIGPEWQDELRKKGIKIAGQRRQQIPDKSKGWKAYGVNLSEILSRMRVDHPVCASILRMANAWGFRSSEGYKCQPAIADKGEFVYLWRTKGGKPRPIAFSEDPVRAKEQRAALDEAIELASKHPKGHLAVPGKTLGQMRNHYYYVMDKFGITRKQLGVVPHGLRHDYLCTEFTEVSGLQPPVLREHPSAWYRRNKAKVQEARVHVARQGGHERSAISGCYVGSVRHLALWERKAELRLAKLLTRCQAANPVLLSLKVQEAWFLEMDALGQERVQGAAVVAVRFKEDMSPPDVARSLQKLSKAISDAAEMSATAIDWTESGRPDDALELILVEGSMPT
jgi:hypothetical protein